MADEKTGPDAVRVYLTGASSDGGAQTDPNASLGNYRSSTEFESMAISTSGGPANVTVDFASGKNGEGAGSLSSESVNSLAWTPYGGAKGDAVTIANGETKLLKGGSDSAKFVRVSRTSAVDLSGTMTVTLTDVYNNLWDNVNTTEQASGDTEYRCLCFKNESSAEIKSLKVWLGLVGTARAVDAGGYAASGAVTVTLKSGNFDDWPDSGGVENDNADEVPYYVSRTSSVLTVLASGRGALGTTPAAGLEDHVLSPIPLCEIAKEAPTSDHATDKTGAGEGSQPAGLTWNHPHSSSDGEVITIGDLAAGAKYFLWVERHVIAAATAESSVLGLLEWTFEAL